jgi:hypothetical protein
VTYCSLLIKKAQGIFACGFFSDAVNIQSVSYRIECGRMNINQMILKFQLKYMSRLLKNCCNFNLPGQTAMVVLLEFATRRLQVLMDFHISVVQTEPQLSPSQQTDDTTHFLSITLHTFPRQFAPIKVPNSIITFRILHQAACSRSGTTEA